MQLFQRGADRDRHPDVVITVNHEHRDFEPRGLVEIGDGRPVDAEAHAGHPLRHPDERGREASRHWGGVPANLVIDGRAQVKHGRVEHQAFHPVGEGRVPEEPGDDTASHRLPGEDDATGAVGERPPHGRLEVTPLRLPVPEVTRRVRRDAEVAPVGHRESGESRAVRDVDDPEHVLPAPVLAVHADDKRLATAREIPRGQRAERPRYGNLLDRNAQRG
jgi:hypothetical protein